MLKSKSDKKSTLSESLLKLLSGDKGKTNLVERVGPSSDLVVPELGRSTEKDCDTGRECSTGGNCCTAALGATAALVASVSAGVLQQRHLSVGTVDNAPSIHAIIPDPHVRGAGQTNPVAAILK